jgi:hypothetical protein
MRMDRRVAWMLLAALAGLASCSSPPPESVPSAETLPERQAAATAAIRADTPAPALPATVADAQKVLDLSTFPLVPGSEAPQRQVAGMTYNAPGSVTEVFDFYVKQFSSGGWQELPGASRTAVACNASYLKNGFQVALTVYGAAKPNTASVNLTQLGNLALEKLPVPRGSNVVYAGPAVAMYSTNASPDDTKQSVRELLAAAGWQPYGKAGDVDFYKQNAIRLSANIAAAPGSQGKTAISYSAELMSADLPAPVDVLDLQYSDSTKQLLFDTALDKQAILDFYRPLLAKTGWEPTHDKLLESGFKEFMIFRNPDKDLLEIETWEVDGKRRVTVEFQTAAEVAEEERRMKEEMERRKAEQNP